ncbi:unnamed protein product [Ceutorhynchus assimilis]|uniref:Myb/SANT-like DNA-binding domain-containing protein n=1 Tax=Ceutorhynchus assimilis TaxID=467358 RepID=A0A9N9QJ02_9CUCU|nr:unnamed protein product [Ceutorhynchus assimilis]
MKRSKNFGERETKLLIELWRRCHVQTNERQAPVMRLIANHLQRYGFFRTPEELKTKIRNLKFRYRRIKKNLSGHEIGTADLDWPYYKEMDDIFSEKNGSRQSLACEDNLLIENMIGKIEDIDATTDDGDDCSSISDCMKIECEEPELMPMPSTIVPMDEDKIIVPSIEIAPKIANEPVVSTTSTQPLSMPRIQIAKNLFANPTTKLVMTPAPKLQKATMSNKKSNTPFRKISGANNNDEVPNLLKELLKVEKEKLEIAKKKLKIEQKTLEVERQMLGAQRTLGSQLLNMVTGLREYLSKVICRPVFNFRLIKVVLQSQ